MFRELPKFANPEMNLAFAGIGSAFYKRFSPELQKLKIKRKISGSKGKKSKGRSRYQVTVPKNARAMGFSGKIFGSAKLGGKSLVLSTKNPVMESHIFGATITSKSGKGLRIRVQTRAAARKTSSPKHKVPFFFRARSVKIPARVDFFGTWGGMRSEIDTRLGKGVERFVARVNRVRAR